MKTTEFLLLGILLMLFGGFIWLRNGPLPPDFGYWMMLVGLLIGVGGIMIDALKTHRNAMVADESKP